ncbi:MAG: 6-pyruvoyl tetrahydropterin synthase family protein [Candidatus Thorarchaeota archaeon]
MTEEISVEVSAIDFAAAHFVSEGGKCERLHGHNYHVVATVDGRINSLGMVIDFRILKQHLRELCKQWDHMILLPAKSALIKIDQKDTQTQVMTPDGTYSFPTKDVKVLSVVETTAEELASLLCNELKNRLAPDYPNLTRVAITLAESPTSRATVAQSV